jgi:hypothetical protein
MTAEASAGVSFWHGTSSSPIRVAMMDRELQFERLRSWIRWRYGEVLGTAFVVVSAPTQLPTAVEQWATKNPDAVWQLIWFESDAVLCGLAPTDSLTNTEQFAVIQHPIQGVTTAAVFSRTADGLWHQLP